MSSDLPNDASPRIDDVQHLLAGVRIVDLTDDYGAFASRVLSDLGAEVVRVEPRDGGRARLRQPMGPDRTSLHHLHRNVGKSVVHVDDADSLDQLLAGADIVFCSDVAPALMTTELAARHPQLIVVSLTPFGISGPAAGWQATELVAQSLAGVVYRSGVADQPPVSAPGAYCEDVGAVVGALASLIALRQAHAGSPGQVVDVSSVLALAQCTDMSLPLWSQFRWDQKRAGAGLYPLFECTDGLACIVLPMSPAEWRSLITWLGSPAEWTGPEWEAAMLGPDERALVMARLPDRFASGTRAELAADGDGAGLRITPVLTAREVLTNEHVKARVTFDEIEVGEPGTRGLVPAGLFGVNGRRSGTITRPRTAAPQWDPRPAARPVNGVEGLPLQGIRVLEIGSGVAAPEAGRVLGEWGADVIKIESRRRPDFQRMVMGGEMNPAFASPNRGKRGFAADLGSVEGQRLVHRLLPHVDVIVENNATGVIDRLGLGWATVSAINPRIVMVSTQLYGDRGPWAAKKGYGPSARAIGGLTWLWAHGPDSPRGVMTIHPDHLAGRLVALGALAGLYARDRSGLGSRLDLAQFEAVSSLLGDLLLHESLEPGSAQPAGNRSAEHAPWNVFRCADDDTEAERWIAVCVPDQPAWASFLGVAPAGFDRPEWSDEPGRLAAVDSLELAVGQWLRAQPAADIEKRLQRAGVPAGQLLFPRTQSDHPHFIGRHYPVKVDQAGAGLLLFEGPAFVSEVMGTPRCESAPLLGQHTAEICRELLNLNDGEIVGLVEIGAIDAPLLPSEK